MKDDFEVIIASYLAVTVGVNVLRCHVAYQRKVGMHAEVHCVATSTCFSSFSTSLIIGLHTVFFFFRSFSQYLSYMTWAAPIDVALYRSSIVSTHTHNRWSLSGHIGFILVFILI